MRFNCVHLNSGLYVFISINLVRIGIVNLVIIVSPYLCDLLLCLSASTCLEKDLEEKLMTWTKLQFPVGLFHLFTLYMRKVTLVLSNEMFAMGYKNISCEGVSMLMAKSN